MTLDMGTVGVIIAITAQFVATVKWGARIDEQLKTLNFRVQKLEHQMEHGGFARCQLHDNGLKIVQEKLVKVEQRIEELQRYHYEKLNVVN